MTRPRSQQVSLESTPYIIASVAVFVGLFCAVGILLVADHLNIVVSG